MSYKIVEHTAEVGIKVRAGSAKELFSESLRGLMDIMRPEIKSECQPVKKHYRLKTGDRLQLLVDFLNEALSLAQINKETYQQVRFSKFSETFLEAELSGFPVESFGEDVKAVTYHRAEIKKENRSWTTVLILDI